jgi:transposase
MIQKTQQAINLDDKSYWIADSALYTEDNIKLLGTGTKWITHVPATVGEAEKLLNADLDFTPCTDPRYALHVTDLNYGGIPQRTVVVWSEEMKKRMSKPSIRRSKRRLLRPRKT